MFYNYTTIKDEYTNVIEVANVIKNMKPKKSPGLDQISIDLIKRHSDPITSSITHLFNVSLKNGKFPDPLKIAKIVPIYKNGDKSVLSNYRPISMLSAISKILEKLIYTRIFNFFNQQNLFYSHQYGFRPRSNTQTAAAEMISKLESWLDEGRISAAIFIDIMKAFDTIRHSTLLTKLKYYGIRGRTYFLIHDYLKNRKQCTVIGEEISNQQEVTWGVIQGGVLAALLFIIYINDMGRLKLSGQLFSYADDTALVYKDYDSSRMQDDMNLLSDYFRINFLSINTKKTKQMVIKSTHKTVPTSNIFVNDNPIERVHEMNYLGIVIDDSLSWNQHIQSLCTQISKYVGILRKLKTRLATDTLKLIYYSLIQSKLFYAVIVWGSASNVLLNRIRTLQNRAIKSVYHLPLLYPTNTLYAATALTILPLNLIYYKAITVYVHQCVKDSIHHNNNFQILNHRINTRLRDQQKLQIPKVSTMKYGTKSIRFTAVTYYNRVPDQIKTTINIRQFKHKLNEWLKSEQE